METGIQISSLKPLLGSEAQVREAFRAVRALGCAHVQLQWIDPSVPAERIAEALRENDLVSHSVQDLYEKVRQDLDGYARLNQCTGGRWLCVSRIPEGFKSEAGLALWVRELEDMSQKLEDRGQSLCFHPVSGDFAPAPGLNGVEYILNAMPQLPICLDLYHLARNCGDMPRFIRRWGSRICMVHFKDSREGRLVPAGSGETDWTGVVEACLSAAVPLALVEQETWDGDPYRCLHQALQWLNGKIRECQ